MLSFMHLKMEGGGQERDVCEDNFMIRLVGCSKVVVPF